MPSRLTDERAQAIAQNYCTNGFNKTQALKTIKDEAGNQFYSDSYCNSLGHKLYNNIKVKAEIEQLQALQAEKVDVEVSEIVQALRIIAFDPLAGKTDRLRALELLGRYKAMFTDRLAQTGPGINITVKARDKAQDGSIDPKTLATVDEACGDKLTHGLKQAQDRPKPSFNPSTGQDLDPPIPPHRGRL